MACNPRLARFFASFAALRETGTSSHTFRAKGPLKLVFIYKGRYPVREARALETLSAMARAAGHETALVYDMDVFGVSDNVISLPALNRALFKPERYAAEALRLAPDWAVFLEGPSNVSWLSGFLKALKGKGFAGKSAVLACPGGLGSAGADTAVYGETEKAFGAFLSALAKGAVPPLIKAEGLADLNVLPAPDMELFSRYEDFSLSYMAYAGKGCSGNCSYCEESLYKRAFGPGYARMRRPAGVVAELSAAKKRHGMKEVIFKDSVFTADKTWLKEFLALYRSEIAVPFKCFGRADAFDAGTAALLKESGCYCVEFGLQTFNEELRAKVLKRPESLADVRKAFAACEAAGLAYDADYIFGLPGETLSGHIEAALAFSELRRLNRIKCHNLVYYRGLPVTDYAIREGFLDEAALGEPADFFSGDRSAPAMRRPNAAFRNLFKLYGLLGRRLFLSAAESGFWRLFRFLPGPLLKILELAAGLARGDMRFLIYLKAYPRRVLAAFLN